MTAKTAFAMLAALVAAIFLALPGTGALAAHRAQAGGASAPGAASAPRRSTELAGMPLASDIATWYGPGLYGRKTACGQTLTPALVGVANRTLPCGTLVKMTYAGHALVVPVIDRGPYVEGREFDLTEATKRELGFGDTGEVWTTS